MLTTRRALCFPTALLGAALVLGGGCKRERAVPPGPGGLPAVPGAPAKPDPAGLVHGQDPHAGAMPADHPPVLQGSQPVPDPPAEREAPADPNAKIAGVLKLGDKVKDKVKAGATVYLVARSAAGGPPLAVKRLSAASWPLPFELTSADVMMTGTAFQGKVVISARVDQDGDAMTKEVGDVEGQSKPVDVGGAKVEIAMETLRTAASGSPLNLGGGGGGPEHGGGALPPGHPQ